ncbi:hypothetical protein SAMN04489717_3663 [Actinopolymorpha singaporensis]|uniref:Transposase IS116/IS110/IS902 family protein n=1 Tax=Actinopolymorpha singaporensis TaxID=117157 RepID=A0A1H1UJU5_9ACTN|nr:hypothetical protein SAMN04489717_3663 [Actinopolymorpha singaporensis]
MIYTPRPLATRIKALKTEAYQLEKQIEQLITTQARQLLEGQGIGPDSAAALLIVAGDVGLTGFRGDRGDLAPDHRPTSSVHTRCRRDGLAGQVSDAHRSSVSPSNGRRSAGRAAASAGASDVLCVAESVCACATASHETNARHPAGSSKAHPSTAETSTASASSQPRLATDAPSTHSCKPSNNYVVRFSSTESPRPLRSCSRRPAPAWSPRPRSRSIVGLAHSSSVVDRSDSPPAARAAGGGPFRGGPSVLPDRSLMRWSGRAA